MSDELEFYKNLAALQGLALHYAVSEYTDSPEEMAREVNKHLQYAEHFQRFYAQSNHQAELMTRVARVMAGEVEGAY